MCQELPEVEVSIIEKLHCEHCKNPLYVRLAYDSTDDKDWQFYMYPVVNCPHCHEKTNITEQPTDNKFHFGFICEDCGHEQLRTFDELQKTVSCVCTKEMKMFYTKMVLRYWGITKGLKFILPGS